MKKRALFIGAALTLMTYAVSSGAGSFGSHHERKAGDAPQKATVVTGKGEMAMEREQSAVIRKIEFENNRVTVVRYRFGPHAKIPMHAVPDLVAIWLSDAHLKLTFSDGTSKVEDRKAGDVEWEPAQRHSGENLADAPLDFIAIQLKDGLTP
ncbi:MAG: cupin domain-containing protein [Betaproteobacteria bacterium]